MSRRSTQRTKVRLFNDPQAMGFEFYFVQHFRQDDSSSVDKLAVRSWEAHRDGERDRRCRNGVLRAKGVCVCVPI
jgi:hypothetical protein